MSMSLTRRFAVAGAVGTLALSGFSATTADAAVPSNSGVSARPVSVVQTTDAARVSCHRPYCYGAISVAYDGSYGLYYNAPGSRGAVRRAQRRCKSVSHRPGTCTKMGWVRNGCMSVAVRTNRYGVVAGRTGFGRTMRRAKMHAMRKLNYRGHILASLCTARNY